MARPAQPTHDAKYWGRVTKGLDFTGEDRVDGASYNRILWKGLMGNQPYPAVPNGKDLRQNREQLLARYHRSQEQKAAKPKAAHHQRREIRQPWRQP
jgi:hypothetical protein